MIPNETLPYFFGYKMGFSLPEMTTNNYISPIKFCCNTSFALPKGEFIAHNLSLSPNHHPNVTEILLKRM